MEALQSMGSIARGFNASTALLQGPSSPDSSLRLPAVTVYGVTIAFCWTVNWQLERLEGMDYPRPVCNAAMREYAEFLRTIAALVSKARLSNGARVLDASDVRVWLMELADKADQAETLEQFLSQTGAKGQHSRLPKARQ